MKPWAIWDCPKAMCWNRPVVSEISWVWCRTAWRRFGCTVWSWTAFRVALHSSCTRKTKLRCRALKQCSSRTVSLTALWAMYLSAITKYRISGMTATIFSYTIILSPRALTLCVRAVWWRWQRPAVRWIRRIPMSVSTLPTAPIW